MYLNPLRDFVRKFGNQGWNRKRRGGAKSKSRHFGLQRRQANFSVAAEVCEPRAMLSGPALITVAPNTGGFINNGSLLTTAPTQLTFTFSPSTSITNSPANLSNISVTRAGADHALGTADDVAVTAGSITVDNQNPNVVVLRFANSLVNDTYQVKVAGTLASSTGAFNSGVTQTVNFSVDFGAQVVSIVPQPVLRTEQLTVGGSAQSLDGQTLTLSMGGGTAVTFQLKNSSTASVVGPNNTGVVYDPGDSNTVIAGKLATAINTAATASGNPLFNTLATPVVNVGAQISLSGSAFTPSVTLSAGGLNVANASAITDGDTFTLAGNGTSATFQFKDTTTASFVTPGNIGITYSPGATAATLTTKILAAINGSGLGAGFASQNGNGVKFSGNPAVTLNLTNAAFLTEVGGARVADGALVPVNNVIDVYFSKTELIQSLAEDPAFYQVVNTVDGSILQPSSVKYDKSGNTAVLTFATNLPSGTFEVTVGAPRLNNLTVTNAVNAGTLYTNDGMAPLPGTLSWLNGSTTVLGSGTYFSELRPGDVLKGPDGNLYKIRTTFGDTGLSLATAYTGTTTGGATSRVLFQAATTLQAVTGSTAWTSGSASVVGFGTFFTTELQTGELILGPDGNYYRIANIGSDVALTLSTTSGATNPLFTTSQLITTATGQTQITGTTSWTNGSATVLGVGTNFLNHLQAGQAIIGADNNYYTIASIASDTSLTLTKTFTGKTLFGITTFAVPYSAYVTVAYVGDLSGSSTSTSAFGLYKFTTAPGAAGVSVTVNASDLAAGFGGNVLLKLFDATGTTVLGSSTTNTLTVAGLTAGTTYIVGVSGVGNVYDPTTGLSSSPGTGTGSVKLTIGTTNTFNANPSNNTTSFATATDLGTLGAAGLTTEGQIIPGNASLLYPPFPGGTDTPGNGGTQDTLAAGVAAGERTDAPPGTTPAPLGRLPIFYYNFQDIYGADPQGNTLHNAITENQKNDARQILDMYGQYLGLQFVETANSGLTIVTGDARAVDPGIDPTSVGGIYGSGVAIMNGQLDYGSSPYGGTWMQIAFHEIGHALGLQHSFDAPGVMGGGAEQLSGGGVAFPPAENVFPGDIALVPAKVINPPDSVDIDVYKFVAPAAGTLSAETFAQRLTDALGNAYPSLLDSVITIYSDATVQATTVDTFGIGGFQMTFTASALGAAGNGLNIVFTKSDLGANKLPKVTVAGSTINIVLNSNVNASGSGTPSTAQNLITALASDDLAKNVISASVTAGSTSQVIGNATLTPAVANLTTASGVGNRTIIARNDDYFGRDSFVNIHLDAGTYYVAISSTGNTGFDPTIPNSGFNGRTDGLYQLKLNFTPDPKVGTTLNDLGGIALDADGQNTPGGTFNFWFQSTSGATGATVYVDKANVADISQDGTINHPYSTISAGLQAAAAFAENNPGAPTILRIVGNGGFDGNLSSTTDSLPYLIGFDSQNNAAADGSTFIVPEGVTVMIDAGAVVKLHSAIIDAGNSVPGVNRDGGSLQVLGTPTSRVTFTSLFDDSIGGRSDPFNFNPVAAGDWGGLVYRQASDFQGKDWLGSGIYLNSVNQANLIYGGGQVFDGSVLQVFDPIFLSNSSPTANFFARPAIWFNNITLSAGAAISADPNSFANTEDRSGPDVYGNVIVNDTVNGFFIRIRTSAGQPIDTLGITARIKHTDITYVLAENLFLVGNPGGPFEPDPFDATHTGWQARLAASLVLDPGVILKLSGSRIETQVGQSQFLAEGTSSNPVIFTSLADDTYGAGGSFDTNNDGTPFAPKAGFTAAKPQPGDWGGLFYNSDSKGSIDHAVIQYGGGTVPIAGGFANFNPVEIQQADVRITNSLFEFNLSGADATDRNGLQTNDASTIFVRGAQPVIVDNVFIQNAGAIISVNANALNTDLVPDWGRSTGLLDAFGGFVNNHGPLIALNEFINNDLNGMVVRGEEITTQTIWDDTSIVHILESQIDDVINQHTFGGITLESSTSASLVVKLTSGGGFNINGIPLDINDRIGGALQIVGTSAFPVVLTSLKDDTVGAGFQPNGMLVTDTNDDGNLTKPAAGDWNGITLGPYTNDRNVATIIEGQPTTPSDNDSTPSTAQFLGGLAPDLVSDSPNNPNGGNDYQPLGFAVHGTISQPSDVDVYSFTAQTGTEVWFDLGLTSPGLASMLELVDSNGVVLARSNGGTGTNVLTSFAVTAMPLVKDPTLGGDFYSNNPHDAGMRVILPGAAGTSNTYYIRVRSDQGLSQGEYELQVRLRQQWESPGALIQYSSIKYATTGIQVNGLPGNSVLTGDTVSTGTNTSQPTAQNIGNMLASNQASITVEGNIQNPSQVDWYKFNLTYDLIEAIAGFNAGGKTWSTIFDVDYAAGLTRPDTTISVFDSTGKLILISRDSMVTTDQSQFGQGTGLNNLDGGSVSALDPYIGPAQMPAGTPGSGSFTYYVAISSNLMIPTALSATFTAQSGNTQVRLEPVESVKRIVEDHIGFTGFTTGDFLQGQTNNLQPTTGAILPINTTAQMQQSVTPYTLSDLVLYTVNTANANLRAVDPFSGKDEYDIGNSGDFRTGMNIKMRSDGTLWAYNGILNDTGNVGKIYQIDPGTGATLATLGSDSIGDKSSATDTDPNHLSSDTIDSFMWVQTGVGQYDLYVAVHDAGGTYNGGFGASRFYRANPANGSAVVANTPFHVLGELTTSSADNTTGFVKGMEVLNGNFYGVTSTGKFVQIVGGSVIVLSDLSAQVGAGGFTGLTLGPQNLANPADFTQLGYYANLLFASTASGKIVAIDPTGAFPLNPLAGTPQAVGALVPVFANGAISAGNFTGGYGLAFSPLDINLWHPTMNQFNAAGHGINPSFDNSRNGNDLFPVALGPDARKSTEQEGGASYYFGLEDWVQTPAQSKKYFTYGNNGQYGVASSTYQRFLTSNDAASGLGYNYNLPGGAHGSLVSQSFSLSGYSFADNPTLYFNYLLDTEGATSHNQMVDSARVYISQDNGVTWQSVASNNISPVTNVGDQGNPSAGFELPSYTTPSVNANLLNPTTQQIQPLYGTNQWRQARIDLSYYAGQPNLRLRFDFSTSGTTYADLGTGATTQGLHGDSNGAGPNNVKAGQNNAHAGWYIDDIIVGLANRGEMVTGDVPNFNAGFTQLPQNPAFGAPKQSLTGPYELSIRSGTEYGVSLSGISPNILITNQYDANTSFTSAYSINAPAGNSVTDGQTFTISDGVNSVTFEFDSNNVLNTPTNQRITFTTSDTSPVLARAIRDAINSAQSAGKFKVVAEISDGAVTGTGTITTSTNTIINLNYAVAVSSGIPSPALTATITGATTIQEGGPTISTTGVLTRPASGPLGAITVPLSLIDTITGLATGVATVTPTVTFLAGATTSSTFTVTRVNNGLVDGTRTIAVLPIFNGFTSVTAPITIRDDETAALQLSGITATVTEGGAVGTATVTRNTVAALNGSALSVTVTSLDPSRLQMISGVQSGASVVVTIPAGAPSATFNFKALTNGFQGDGTLVKFVVSADGFVSTTGTTTTVDSTTAAQVIPQAVVGNIKDTTPSTAANQTNGNIVIDQVFSAGSNFGSSATPATAVWLGFAAKALGAPATPIVLNVQVTDLGTATDTANVVFVSGNTYTLQLNNHAGGMTTANALIAAIQANAGLNALINAAVSVGSANAGTTNLAATATNGAVITLTQAVFSASNTEGGVLNVSYSGDGGTTWAVRQIATGAGTGESAFPVADSANAKPTVASDAFGNLFVTYRSSNGPSMIVLVSTDFGQSFSLMQNIGIDIDQPRMVAGSGSVWVAYRLNSGDVIQVKAAAITGLGGFIANPFTLTENVTQSNGNGSRYPSIAMGPTGQIAVAWADPLPIGGGTRINIAVDPDGLGVTPFGLAQLAAATSSVAFPSDSEAAQGLGSINAAPDIAWDHNVNGTISNVYLVYTDSNPITGKNISLKTNTFNTSTSSFSSQWRNLGATLVNDDTNNSDQFMPRVAVDNFGTPATNPTQGDVVITWLDTRNGGATLAQEFGAVYSRTGQTLGNIQIGGLVNANASASGIGLGAYTGLDAFNGSFFPMWSDNTVGLAGNNGFNTTLDEATMKATINPTPAGQPTATVVIAGPLTQGSGAVLAGTITIPLSAVSSSPQTFNLTSSDTTILTLPLGTVTIPAFSNTASFFVNPVSFGAVAYVERTAVVTAALTGYESIPGQVDVTGGLTPSLTISGLAANVTEGNTISGTVTRNTPTAFPLTVTIYSTEPSQLSAAQPFTSAITVTIPAGATSTTFQLTGVEDFQADGAAVVKVYAVAQGFLPSNATVTVNDSGRSLFTLVQLQGDGNTAHHQGHLQIVDNTISYSQQYGIAVDAGARIPGNIPHPGPVRNLPTLNTQQLVPAPNIANNVINNFGVGGILFSGDPNTGNVATAAVPYGRIVNNTIYGGGTTAGGSAKVGTGISVTENASPTIMNNIVSTTATGISVDATSNTTVVTTTVYKDNNVNLTGVADTFGITLASNDPLFIKPSIGNFYLAEGSKAIDSSLNTLQDRASIANVLSVIGLPPSPIIAPTTDVRGQLRVDDPFVPNAVGLGQNIFLDRGAIERADFTGPTAQLVTPLDNGAGDGDPTLNKVLITTTTPLTVLSVRLNDSGAGIDNSTVTSSAFVLKQDGVTLVAGQDYQFVYDPNTHTAQFQSISVFPSSSTYTITVPDLTVIKDIAGNNLQPNQINGTEVFTIVGNVPPTLTSFTTVQAVENATTNVTYGQLLSGPNQLANPANLSVVAGHTPELLITSTPTGTLTITKTSQPGSPTFAVVPGNSISANNTNLVEPGDVLHWTPALNFVGSTAAFTAIGYDPQNHLIAPTLDRSSTPVPFNFNVIDPSPTLASDATIGLAAVNPIGFPITYATLVTNLGANWIEATTAAQKELQITGVVNGTLALNGVVQSSFPFLMGPNDTLTWTPPAVLPGSPPVGSTDPVPAFTVVAYDAFNAANFPAFTLSSPTRTVTVNVLNVTPPTVVNTAITIVHQPQFVPTSINYSQILSLSGAAIGVGGDTLAFRVESLQNGSLQITHSGTTTSYTAAQIATKTVFILPGDTVIWTSPVGAANTTLPAFTVSPFDVEQNLDGFVNVGVSVQLENQAPTLTSISTLQIADQQTPFNIGYQTLLNASNAADPNQDAIQFRITAVQNGTMTVQHNGIVSNVVPGTTLIGPGDTATWTPAAGVIGNSINAFSVTAFDGSLSSASPVQVNVVVRAFGSAYDLSGTWLVQSPSGVTQGLGRITQSGANLTLVNYNGVGSSGTYTGFARLNAAVLDNSSNVTGNVDTSTADDGRIQWSDGFTWLRVSLGGQWAVTSGGSTTLGSIVQSNNLVTLTSNQGTVNATIGYNSLQSRLQLTFPGSTSPFANDTFTVGSQVWVKLDLPPNYTSSLGGAANVIQNGTTSLTFVNNVGQTSPGFWISPTQVVATAFGNEVGTVGNGKISWSTGEVWNENVALAGSQNGNGATTITVAPPATPLPIPVTVTSYINSGNGLGTYAVRNGTNTALFINGKGQMVLGTYINATQVNVPAWGNDVATFVNGQISWSDGSTWTQTVTNSNPVTVTSYLTVANQKVQYSVQNASGSVAFINGQGNFALGTFTGASQVTVPVWGNDVATFSAGVISWSDGNIWVQTTFAPPQVTPSFYVNPANGKAQSLIRNGSYLIFVNGNGAAVFGSLTSPTQFLVPAWGNLVGTISGNQIIWANNTSWTQTSPPAAVITGIDPNGAASHLQITSKTTLIGLDGPLQGVTGTRNGSRIQWSNGQVWDNYDFNALNALFQMAVGYP